MSFSEAYHNKIILLSYLWDITLAAGKLNQAKAAVIKAAGVQHLNVKQKSIAFETTFSNICASLRFDVEYYQPIHYKLRERLEKAQCVEGTKIAKLNKATVNPKKFPTNTYHYIDISSIDSEVGDYEPTTILGYEAPTRARKKPKKGDLIISTVRPNRNAVAVIGSTTSGLVVSTGFSVITPVIINSLVLFAILKTEPIYAQIVRKATAAMYPAVTEDDVIAFLSG